MDCSCRAPRFRARRVAVYDADSGGRPPTGTEWAAVARALAAHGLVTEALSLADVAEGLDPLELGRWHWRAGHPERAADHFARARAQGLADPRYLALCEAAARADAESFR